MKKIISIALASIMTISMLAGCGGKKDVVINTTDDLKGLNIGVQGGTTGESWVKENITQESSALKSYKSGMDAALELKSGVLDCVVIDEQPAKAIVAKNDDLKILEVTLGDTESYAIAVKKGDTELLESINKTYADMQANGEFQKILDAYIPADGNIVVPEDYPSGGDKILKVGTNAQFAPFEYVDGDKIVGIDMHFAQKIAQDYGATLEIVDMNFDSLISALSAGTIDFIAAGLSIDEDRKKNVDFSTEYMLAKQVIITRK